MPRYQRGSEWRKWDLHVHAPGGKLYSAYASRAAGEAPLDAFCDALEMSDVDAFGITDYFSADSFFSFLDHFNARHSNSCKRFFFNLELRLNETVNDALELVNVHLLFNPASQNQIRQFLERLPVVSTGHDERPIFCSALRNQTDFESATVTRQAITKAFQETFGPKAERRDHLIVITAANNDGLRASKGNKRKENISDEIDKFSDAFFGGPQNVLYYAREDRFEDKTVSPKKAIISGSDAHSFDDLERYLGKTVVRQGTDKVGKPIDVNDRSTTWIKADLTYEGFKQILFEPNSGERVFIGPVKPDQKEDFKVIRKIKFDPASGFPQEIELNDNLCSIIGSRSSGKSALLAYIAHAVDPRATEEMVTGPGDGDAYKWNALQFKYTAEWANGKSTAENSGRVVYVPQNHLFDKSKDPAEVTKRIKPVMFAVLPTFAEQFRSAEAGIDAQNISIFDGIEAWFAISTEIAALLELLKALGDRKAIEQAQKETTEQIRLLTERTKLSEEELKKYQEIASKYSSLSNRNKEIDKELLAMSNGDSQERFFGNVKLSLTPTIAALPPTLQQRMREAVQAIQEASLTRLNEIVKDYQSNLNDEKAKNSETMTQIRECNAELIAKHKKNAELDPLIKASTTHQELLDKISTTEAAKKAKEEARIKVATEIQSALQARSSLLKKIESSLAAADQSAIRDINFSLEYRVTEDQLDELGRGLNLREKTQFVDGGQIRLDEIRSHPDAFLLAMHSGRQKTKDRFAPLRVSIDALQLTESVQFTAVMEGDKIGGFSAPTMTPGKRALFALRLILAESGDTWPLLIDQPEDDLDSRSIYNEVVPFLKEKKRERQIIMVSHNANLVVGADSEQIIVANRHGDDRKNADGRQFNYCTGSLEHAQPFDSKCDDTLEAQGICEHACAILDGGKTAFEGRKNKYQLR